MRSDRWSETSEIKKALTKSGMEGLGGPVLYHNNGQNWMYTNEGHLVFLGVSGSGKSRRGTIPMVKSFIEAGESFIVVDPKGEIHYQTAANAEGKYTIHVIDFRHVFESERWNPLAAPYEHFISGNPIRKQTALELIDELSHTLYPVNDKSDPFWPESARSLFIGAAYALMMLGSPEQVNMAGVYHLIAQGEERFGGPCNTYLKEFVNTLPENSVAAMMLKSYVSTASDTAAGIRSTFLEGISMFARSEGMMTMLGGDDLHINELDGETPTGIYIILPDESPIFDSISGVLCSQLMGHYVRLAQDKYNGKLPCRLNVCLEELGNIGKSISSLPHLMSAGRSRNIRCQLVLQSLSQLDTLYGSSKASTIRSNADVLVAFRTNHWETLSELSNKCGEREVERSNHVSCEKLITPSQLASMKTGQALVMISGHTKFITWLPDFTEMFDCSKWRAPKRIIRKNSTSVSIFNIQQYVRDAQKRKMEAMMGSNQPIMQNPFSMSAPDSGLAGKEIAEKTDSDLDKLLGVEESKQPGFSVADLISKIDEQIAQLEAEEAADKSDREGERLGKTHSVVLIAVSGPKAPVIKAVRDNSKMSLKQAKEAIKKLPYTLEFKMKELADKAMKEISEAGGIVVPGTIEIEVEEE